MLIVCFKEERIIESILAEKYHIRLNRRYSEDIEVNTSLFFENLEVLYADSIKSIPSKGIPTITLEEQLDSWIKTLSCDQLQELLLEYHKMVRTTFNNLIRVHKVEIQDVNQPVEYDSKIYGNDYYKERNSREYTELELLDIEREEYNEETSRIVFLETDYKEDHYED